MAGKLSSNGDGDDDGEGDDDGKERVVGELHKLDDREMHKGSARNPSEAAPDWKAMQRKQQQPHGVKVFLFNALSGSGNGYCVLEAELEIPTLPLSKGGGAAQLDCADVSFSNGGWISEMRGASGFKNK